MDKSSIWCLYEYSVHHVPVYVHVYVYALVSPPRGEQLWLAGQCAPPLGSGEEPGWELQGSYGPWGQPKHPEHGPHVPSPPGRQPWAQQPSGGEEPGKSFFFLFLKTTKPINKQIHPAMHFSLLPIPNRGCWGGGLGLSCAEQKAGRHRADTQTNTPVHTFTPMGNLEWSVHMHGMSFDFGRKLERQRQSHASICVNPCSPKIKRLLNNQINFWF